MLGTLESERPKVTALNLLHPTASPPCAKVSLLVLRHRVNPEQGAGIYAGRNRRVDFFRK